LEKIIINTSDSVSEIFVGEPWESAERLLPANNVVIITDSNVFGLYGKKFPHHPVVLIDPGESSKRFETVEYLAARLIEFGIDRSGFILGIGGGVVCDIAGFLASIYMRGIRCGYISTTLLSQVDASTGGKNGINLGNTKNILGCFRQPEFVICDPVMLQTLSEEEYFSGLSELIKTGIIGNKGLFEIVEHDNKGIIKRDPDLLSALVGMAIRFKATVVSEDERESGIRRILNFGHTFGHAIELFCSLGHGYAVASGMKLAAGLSLKKGYISESVFERILLILNSYGLIRECNVPADQMARLLSADKKKSGSDIYFVFTKGIGCASVEKVPFSGLMEFYNREISGN